MEENFVWACGLELVKGNLRQPDLSGDSDDVSVPRAASYMPQAIELVKLL